MPCDRRVHDRNRQPITIVSAPDAATASGWRGGVHRDAQ
jgi:hypothetical protein